MVDRDELRRQLQESSRELREDIERRQLEIDMAETRQPSVPAIVYKRHDNSVIHSALDDADVPFTDEQMDILGDTLAHVKADLRDDVVTLRERIAVLEGQVQALLILLGGEKSIEASVVRKLKAG